MQVEIALSAVSLSSANDKYLFAFPSIDDASDTEQYRSDKPFGELLFDIVVKHGNAVELVRSDIYLIAVKAGKPLLAWDVELNETHLPKTK
jgi:hypothetical protein